MLSDATLNRVSLSYARGYRDGYTGTTEPHVENPEAMKPFKDADYNAGHCAGACDAISDKALAENKFRGEHRPRLLAALAAVRKEHGK